MPISGTFATFAPLTASPSPPPWHRDRSCGALAALCLCDLLLLAPRLRYPDLALDYPFMDGDSWDWIANGLRLAGHGVRFSGRPPLLPLAIALLDRLGALPWLPVLLQLLFLGTVLAFHRTAARLASRPAAFVAALALLGDHSLRALSLQVMADLPAACLLFLSARAFLLAIHEDRPRRYLAGGLLGGLAALAQPAAWLLAPAVALTLAAQRRRDLRSPWLAAGGLAFVAPPLLWSVARRALGSGQGGDIAARQWDLLRLHANAIPFYLWSLAALLGLPACALLAAGAVAAGRRAARRGGARDAAALFVLTLTALLLAFFVCLYDFAAERFLVYAVWPAGLLIALALARLPRGAPFVVAAAVLVAGAALPLPSAGGDPAWIGLWPLPPVYAHATLTAAPSGSARLAPGGITVQAFPAASLFRLSLPARVWSARAAFAAASLPGAPPRLAPARVAGDRGALYLYARDGEGGGRYRTLTRLGDALRKRVEYVPLDWLAPQLPHLGVEPVGEIYPDYAVYRARLPGLAATWLLVTPREGAARRTLATAGRSAAPADPLWLGGLAHALSLRDAVRGSDGYVALIPDRTGRSAAALYLPFVLETTELYVIAPGDEAAVRALAAAAPGLGPRDEETRDGARVRRFRHLGRRASLVDFGR